LDGGEEGGDAHMRQRKGRSFLRRGILTDFIYRSLLWHVLGSSSKHIHSIIFAEEVPTQLRKVANKYPWVQLAKEKTAACFFK
jgi:hypothetical protein